LIEGINRLIGGKITRRTLFLLCFSFTMLKGDFIQKWYIPNGLYSASGRILIDDTDRDGNLEFLFTTYGSLPHYVYIHELHLPDVWEVDSIITPGGDLLWDIGNLDSDGFYDLVLQFHIETPTLADGIMIYESPDSFSYPTTEMWRDTAGQAAVQPISVYDIDQDSIPELIANNGDPPNWLWIYESTGDNQYDTVFTSNPDTNGLDGPVSTHGFGDFDQDGRIEFVVGGMSAGALGATYWIYESPANNVYEQIIQDYVLTKNIKDCFAVPDADGDGKWEFVVKGYVIPSSEIDAFIFEAIGDNTYEIIDTLVLPGGDYYGGYSAAGDVDGDSVPEIVLEARQNVFIIKAAGNDSFYVWDTLPGNASGSSIAVYDIDGNGYQEIVISGNDETRIYEYDFGIEEYSGSINKKHYHFATIFSGPLLLPKGVNCRVFDITGRVVVAHHIKPGIYFIEVDGEIRQKIVKIR